MSFRRKALLAAVSVTLCGVVLGAHELLSYQIDAAGLKQLGQAWIAQAAGEARIEPAARAKVATLVDRGIDAGVPVAREIYRALGQLETGGSQALPEKATKANLDELFRSLHAAMDLKERMVSEAGQTLTPGERARLIVGVAQKARERIGLAPEQVEQFLDTVRTFRRARLKGILGLSDQRARTVTGEMDRFVAQRKTIRQSRRDLLSRLSAACARNASGSELSSLLGEWDALGARASDVTRAQLAAARKLLTADETVRLALNAKQRIDRVLKMVALIGRFHPVD